MSDDERASDRWENEGGRNRIMDNWPAWDDNRIRLLSRFEHKEPVDDDLGLPEHPIYSNFSKYLWKPHTRSGGVQITNVSAPTPKKRAS